MTLHANNIDVAKGQHKYEGGEYKKDPGFVPSEYPKHVFKGGKSVVVADADEEAAKLEAGFSLEAPKEE